MSSPDSPRENTGRVVALALSFFGGLAALGYAEGVFAKLSSETVAALAIFAAAYAIATYALDARVRDWVGAPWRRGPTKATAKSPGASPAAT